MIHHQRRVQIDEAQANRKMIFNFVDQVDQSERIERAQRTGLIQRNLKRRVKLFELLIDVVESLKFHSLASTSFRCFTGYLS